MGSFGCWLHEVGRRATSLQNIHIEYTIDLMDLDRSWSGKNRL